MTIAAFDHLVSQLERSGVARDAAVKHARGKYPEAAIEKEHQALKRADILEKEEQTEVTKLFRAFRFEVRNLSQYRPSKVAPGLPDLFVTHRELPIGFFWETKRQVGARASEAQKQFRADCLRCKIGHGYGDRFAARSHLIALGLATVVNGTLEPVR
jgi:hypothetical protein